MSVLSLASKVKNSGHNKEFSQFGGKSSGLFKLHLPHLGDHVLLWLICYVLNGTSRLLPLEELESVGLVAGAFGRYSFDAITETLLNGFRFSLGPARKHLAGAPPRHVWKDARCERSRAITAATRLVCRLPDPAATGLSPS